MNGQIKKRPIPKLNLGAGALFLVFMALTAVWGVKSYTNLVTSMDRYTLCQTAARDMKDASDYLTDQARHFAALRDPVYMQNYFTEANVTRRRDQAVETLEQNFAGSDALDALSRSLKESRQLMATEYYSMRLVCEASDIDPLDWPEEIRAVTLTSEDQALTGAAKLDKAVDILLDLSYHELKTSIDADAERCTDDLLAETSRLSDHYRRLMIAIFLMMLAGLSGITVLSVILGRAKRDMEEYQEELKQAKHAAEESSAAKSRFLFNMSHDIRTPMNAILGFTELLEKRRFDDEAFAHGLESIRFSGTYLLDIINNVLDMARIENGKVTPEETIVRPESLNERVEAVFGGEFEKKHLGYRFICDGPLGAVYTDQVLLSKVILNLVGNSVKFTSDGGHISLEMRETPAEAGTRELTIAVRDDGEGMTKEFLPHAFASFAREQTSTDSGKLGTGLGLGIVKGIIDCLGGRVRAESELGKGTVITLRIPVRAAEEQPPEPEAEPETPDFTGKRILLAEDNDLNAEISIDLLEETGAEVQRAEDGLICCEALENAPDGWYSLILMDIQMPNLDGYGAARRVRAMSDPKKANIPILAMTANAFDEDKKNAFAAGMNGHLAKPIDRNELMRQLSIYLK